MTALLTIPPQEAFDFNHILGYLERSSNECMYGVEGSAITKLISVMDEHVLIQVSSQPDGSLTIRCPIKEAPLDDAYANAIVAYVRDWFDMDRDLLPFLELAGRDAVLSVPARQFGGLRIVGIEDLFEALCWGIMGQQINLAFAYTLKRRFVERYGTSVYWNGSRYWAFPSPQTIASLDQAELREMQFTGRKAEYVIGTSRLMAEGSLSKAGLLALSDWMAMEKALTRIRGIGPWTANYVLMRCLRVPAAFPIEDVGLHNALKLVLGRDSKPSIDEIKALSAPWGEWKAYATFYLWRLLY
ncbi:DNA-3-methyladenine glycosylase 2 [Paenibacillus rhizovicinus]|uniref:DNA-3-methyladenine glycosylase II n=1 Tax=Paenibacillus rhizovicinus TaxID=2704463 RepID=A0A6C0P7I1_9BACL|nr:DNA-3-methyladenine glycosylase 2 [Paenibacillus rhizovicinus]QHW34590.1 DNA-3-methyladenine glycosylase 2 [Paenibacillus rhizovicinus]